MAAMSRREPPVRGRRDGLVGPKETPGRILDLVRLQKEFESPLGVSAQRLDAAISSATRCLNRQFFEATEEPVVRRRHAGRGRLAGALRSERVRGPAAGGFWCGELEADTTLESDYILFLHLLAPGKHQLKISRLARYVARHQLEDGTWNIYHGGPGELSATVKAYLALKLAGYSVDGPLLVKAREAILRLGGAENVNSYTKIYLALLDLYPREDVPALPPEVVLLPRFFYFNIYEISYWSRAILIPLSILYAKWTVDESAATFTIDEVFIKRPKRGRRSSLEREAANGARVEPLGNGNGNGNGLRASGDRNVVARNGGLFSWKNFFLTVNRVLKIVERTPVKPLRSLALKKAEEWMIARLEDSDGLGAIFPSMVNSVLAMRCLGYSENHPLVSEEIEKLEELEIAEGDEIRMQPCLSPVWDTALAINALGEAGLNGGEHEMVEAGRWLVSKEVRRAGDWQKRVRDAVEISGWAFQFRNDFYPDIDDTAAVIMALGRLDPTGVDGIEASVVRGLNWMLSLQCSSGGWAAFDADVEREVFNEVPYADHNAMLDPACADITGRVLEMFGRFPSLRRHPRVRSAIVKGVEYLKNTQEKDGSWYGRWGVNYLYGTWQALKGLIEVGESSDQGYIRRAVSFLKCHQNADGGWGESCLTYEDPSTAGQGVSTASQTGWALMGLIATGEIESPEVVRGMRYLLDTQLEDGGWHDESWTGAGFPRVFYLKYHLYQVYFPLFALGHYRNVRDGVSSIDERVEVDLDRRFDATQTMVPVDGIRYAGSDDSSGNGGGEDSGGLAAAASTHHRRDGVRKKGSFRAFFGLLI